jgi:hypothetical protein
MFFFLPFQTHSNQRNPLIILIITQNPVRNDPYLEKRCLRAMLVEIPSQERIRSCGIANFTALRYQQAERSVVIDLINEHFLT